MIFADVHGAFLSPRGPDVREDPVGHLRALLSTRLVPKAEMHTVVDADIDHIGCHIREATIGPGLLRGLRVIAVTVNVISSFSKNSASVRVSAPVTLLAP